MWASCWASRCPGWPGRAGSGISCWSCALSGALLGDQDGVYDPAEHNDRLLLGLKGTLSEALCRYRHRTSYADIAVMPTRGCEFAAGLAGSASRSA
jgi:hypothetical protein